MYPDAPKFGGYSVRRVEHGPELKVIRRRLAVMAGEFSQAA